MLDHLSESDATLPLGNDDCQPPVSQAGKRQDLFHMACGLHYKTVLQFKEKLHPHPTPTLVQRGKHFTRIYFVHLKQ